MSSLVAWTIGVGVGCYVAGMLAAGVALARPGGLVGPEFAPLVWIGVGFVLGGEVMVVRGLTTARD